MITGCDGVEVATGVLWPPLLLGEGWGEGGESDEVCTVENHADARNPSVVLP